MRLETGAYARFNILLESMGNKNSEFFASARQDLWLAEKQALRPAAFQHVFEEAPDK
jgi:hypothetical protein